MDRSRRHRPSEAGEVQAVADRVELEFAAPRTVVAACPDLLDASTSLGVPERREECPRPPPSRELLDWDTVGKARLILTCGLPGAGKTTLATRLAAERGAVRLTKDEWLWALGSTPWDEALGAKVEQELWHLARDLLRLGVSVVLDFGLWARVERDEMRSAARGLGVGVELHVLDLPAEVLWSRIEERNTEPPWDGHPIRRADLDGWLRIFQAPDPAELALFDPPPASD